MAYVSGTGGWNAWVYKNDIVYDPFKTAAESRWKMTRKVRICSKKIMLSLEYRETHDQKKEVDI